MNQLVKSFFSILALLSFCSNSFADELSANSIEWANQHPIASVGIDSQFPPFDYVNEAGQPAGIGELIRKELNTVMPLQLEVVSATTFAQEYEKLKSGQLDAVSVCAFIQDRETEILFSKPILTLSPILAVANDYKLPESGQVSDDFKVAVTTGYATRKNVEKIVKNENIVTTANTAQGLEMVANGEVDGFVTYLYTLAYLTKSNNIQGLKPLSIEGFEALDLGYCIDKDKPHLAKIINWAIAEVGSERLSQLQTEWSENYSSDSAVNESSFNLILFVTSIAVLLLIIPIVRFSQRYT